MVRSVGRGGVYVFGCDGFQPVALPWLEHGEQRVLYLCIVGHHDERCRNVVFLHP